MRIRYVMACRALLRSLPTFSASEFDLVTEMQLRLIAATFRAAAVSWVASRFGTSAGAVGLAARGLVRATDAYGDALQDEVSGHLADSAHAVLASITDHNARSNDAAEAIIESFRAASVANIQRGTRRDTWDAFAFDCGLIETGTSPDVLAAKPLWPDAMMPDWASENWRQIKSFLELMNEDWDVWTDWYSARLRGDPGAEVIELARLRNVTDEEWNAGPVVANAKLRTIIDSFQALGWASALDESVEADAPPITVKDDQLQFSPSADSDDRAVAGRPSMKGEYENIRELGKKLRNKVASWANDDIHPDWIDLKSDVTRLTKLMPPSLDIAVENIGVLWAAGVSVAEYLDQDRQLRTDSTSGNAPPLPLSIRNALNAFVQIFAGWLLEFPTVARREENAHAYKGALERLDTAKRVVAEVRSSNALKTADLELLEELLRTAGKTGPQAAKARFWSFATLRRLLLSGGSILARAAAGQVAGEVVESSVLLERLTKLMVQGEAAVAEFIIELPTSSREALLALIEKIRGN